MTDSSPSLAAAGQAAWEAPELRPVFTRFGEREKWAHPCPDWCVQGVDHDVEWTTEWTRRHASTPLRVRQDGTFSYEGIDEATGVHGVIAGHLEVSLVAASRDLIPRMAITAYSGKGGEEKEMRLAGLYPDEVRELICVLQHLLKVGQGE